MEPAEQYQRFISWQCRLRKLSVRELAGRPTQGMSAGVHSVSGGEEQSRMNFLILHKDSRARTAEFRHIVRKSRDPSQWIKNGLRILSERHYQDEGQFENELTALCWISSRPSPMRCWRQASLSFEIFVRGQRRAWLSISTCAP